MYGAIIGDLAGSIYEYDQIKKVKPVHMNKLIEDNAFYSDDTILTIAILDAVLNDKNYDKYLREYVKKYSLYKPNIEPYFKYSFSPNTIKWSDNLNQGFSTGNGAMMRISSVGYLFESEEEVIMNAKLATIPSHNSPEAISSATIIALMIFYFRKGFTKEEIYNKLNFKLEYKPFLKFNMTCSETIGNILYVIYKTNSFEESIRETLLMGGDTDTNCAIVGSVAEAIYGINDELKKEAEEKIPNEFVRILKKVK